jgi:hypothetical protein
MKSIKNDTQSLRDSHSRIIESIKEMFKPLNEDMLDLMCYCAYVAPEANGWNIEFYIDKICDKLPKKRSHAYGFFLQNKGFLWDEKYHRPYEKMFSGSSVTGKYIIPALYYLITERRSLYDKMRQTKTRISPEIDYICQVIERISQGKEYKSELAKLDQPKKINVSYFDAFLTHPEMHVLADVVHPKYCYSLILYVIAVAQADDLTDYIPLLERLSANIEAPEEKTFAKEAIAYARYCYDGTYEEIPSPASFWGYSLKGIHLAYAGDIDAAADAFAAGFMTYNNCPELILKYCIRETNTILRRGVYEILAMSYYSAICFARSSNKSYRENVSAIRHVDKTIAPLRELRDYYKNSGDDDIVLSGNSLSTTSHHNSYALLYFVAKYVAKAARMTKVDNPMPIHKPVHKLLAHEMRSMFTFTPEELQELDKLYGNKSLLLEEKSVPGDPELVWVQRSSEIEVKPIKGCSVSFNTWNCPWNGYSGPLAAVVENANGERCQVVRNIPRELELYKIFSKYINDLRGNDHGELNRKQMLELMNFVKDKPEFSIKWEDGQEPPQ